jgi:hypothetical protein
MYAEHENSVLVFTRSESDRFGTHFVSSRLFGAEYLRWGLQPEFLDITQRDDLDRAVELLRSGRVALAHCEQGCGLDLQYRTQSRRKNLFDHFRVPVVAHIRDYPFCEWMRPRLLDAPDSAIIFHTDEFASEMLPQLGITKGQHLFAPHVYLDYRQPGPNEVEAARRDIGVLYVGSYKLPGPHRDAFLEAYPDLRWAIDGLIDAGMDEYRTPIHRILHDKVLRAHGGEVLDPKALSDLLFSANQFIRFERRRRLFVALVRHPVHIVWAGPRPEVEGAIRANIRPAIRLLDALALMSRARFMVMTLNNFSHSLSERMLSAMARGCVPITQSNALIDREFAEGRGLLLLKDDLSNLASVLDACPEGADFDRLSRAAQQRVIHEYSPAARVRQFLTYPSLRRAFTLPRKPRGADGAAPAEPAKASQSE